MLTHSQLRQIAKMRLRDSRILFGEGRYDGSIYLCGYAVELALKAVICKNLGLKGIPGTSEEFDTTLETIKKMKTHNLETLLGLIGAPINQDIKSTPSHLTDWSTVLSWDPELRYAPIKGEILKPDAQKMISATKRLLSYFWNKM